MDAVTSKIETNRPNKINNQINKKIKTGGRKKRTPNKISGALKDAILEAASMAGGEHGLVGYLQHQATTNPSPFLSLLGKVLPMQVTGKGGGPLQVAFKTVYEQRGD